METMGLNDSFDNLPKVHISAKDYDQLMDKFDTYEGMTKLFWPSLDELSVIEKKIRTSKNPIQWIAFCIYLHDYGEAPKTNEEKYSKKNLFHIINESLVIDEEEEENSSSDSDSGFFAEPEGENVESLGNAENWEDPEDDSAEDDGDDSSSNADKNRSDEDNDEF